MPDEVDPQVQPTIQSLADRVQMLEDGLHMHRHTGWDLTQPLLNTPISGASFINASTLGDGTSTSGTLTLLRASGRGSVYIRGGTIAAGDFANAAAKSGFIIGEDDTDGKDKFFFGSSTAYIKYDGTTLTVIGSVAVSSLNIPDTTTANSFHVDTSGNAWWGANVASGLANANAYIDNTGHAVFKSVSIGGAAIQYVITNSGIFSYGDGSDGSATLNGSNTFGWAYAGVTVTLAFSGSAFSNTNHIDFTINGNGFSILFQTTINPQYGVVKTSGTLATDVTNLLAFLQSPTGNTANQKGFDVGTGAAALLSSFTWTKSSNTITGVSNNSIPQQVTIAGTTSATATYTTTYGGTQGNDYWLSRDIYVTDMTIATGVTLHPNGWRIFGTGTLTLNGTATIERNGQAGYAMQSFGGNNGIGGIGGGSLADGYLKGTPLAGSGAGGSATPGLVPSISNSVGVAGVGGNGGAGDAAVVASNVKLIANWHLAPLLDVSSTGATVKFNGSNSSGGGGSGGINPGQTAGGGGGSAGGFIAIYFRNIVIGASASITVNGGAGGNGTNQFGLGGGISGNGNGGSGGVAVLVYNQLTNSGTISATAGIAGSGGNGGTAGNGGNIYEFQLSL